jgi:hypothetical protein
MVIGGRDLLVLGGEVARRGVLGGAAARAVAMGEPEELLLAAVPAVPKHLENGLPHNLKS